MVCADTVPHFDHNDASQQGPAVAIAPEFEEWEPFLKFKDKVGVLKRPHLAGTGMWWVEMEGVEGGAGPHECEFAFHCGPVLHQLKFVERAAPQEVKSEEEREAESWQRRTAMVVLAQNNAKGLSPDDERLRKILNEVAYRQKCVDEVLLWMEQLREELATCLAEARDNDRWWRHDMLVPLKARAQAAEVQAQQAAERAAGLEKELSATKRLLVSAEASLQVPTGLRRRHAALTCACLSSYRC